jgi:integrase
VKELLDLVVKDYADEAQDVPNGMYEALNYALGHLRAVEDVESTQLDELCREWRRRGIRWQKDAAAKLTERPACRVRVLTPATCNRYMAFLRRGYALGKEKLGIVHPTLKFPQSSEPKNPRPIPPDLLAAIFEAMEARDDQGQRLEPEARVKFFRFLTLAGPRKGQVLRTLVEQFTPATGTNPGRTRTRRPAFRTSSPTPARPGSFSSGSSSIATRRAATSSRRRARC